MFDYSIRVYQSAFYFLVGLLAKCQNSLHYAKNYIAIGIITTAPHHSNI